MRTRRGIDALFPAIRKRILATVLLQPERWWYASELARLLELPKTSLQRELVNLVHAGILHKRTEGKQVYYQADPETPFLPELQGLMAKTAGLVDVIREALAPLASRIEVAFVYGSVARAQELSTSDIDLMIVGEVGLKDLALPLRGARARLAREINVSVHSREEFARKARAQHHFVSAVLDKPKLFVIGTKHDVEGIAGSGTSRAESDHKAGARRASRGRAAKPRRRAS
jgi:predicted nucleotidyltransferase